jgi:hypothetical protein
MDSLVVAEILDVLSDKHLDTMTLHLGERGQLEGNGNLCTEWEGFARDDYVVV